jgi:hypothetical protein
VGYVPHLRNLKLAFVKSLLMLEKAAVSLLFQDGGLESTFMDKVNKPKKICRSY